MQGSPVNSIALRPSAQHAIHHYQRCLMHIGQDMLTPIQRIVVIKSTWNQIYILHERQIDT
jgi:hypothetical protein